jgi:D-alanine-D-alanine ligase
LCEEIIPANLPLDISTKIKKISTRVYNFVGCRGFARVDMIFSNGKVYVLEINTLPGLTKNSIFPKQAKAIGMSYSELLDRLIELGRKNY